ncbi:hypothetical protein V493_08137 [Pseudogymnoascus sp. VKM F-4281 (FW-2241)]|nr:hypothetical protein V493_08137 [Pseudogymnoascus sp. VKM F-4281 (FW-2241)]
MAYQSYEYNPLDIERGEIRLVNLLPGEFDDDIHISLHHAVLNIPDDGSYETESPNLETLRKTLPLDWKVDLTSEGRALFFRPEGQDRIQWRTQWTHPDPSHEQDFEMLWQRRSLLSDQPEFEALSYCWGPKEPLERLIIEAHDATTTRATPELDARDPFPTSISVQPNLARAFRHLRYPSRPRTIWVDAICINQADLVERGRHVARMGSIYQLASRVVAFLGPESDDSSTALNALEMLGKQLEMLPDLTLPSPTAIYPKWITNYPCDDRTLRALKSLLNNAAWFQRLWIWQEIVLANANAIVQCGAKVADWYNVRRGLVILRETTLPDARMRKSLMSNSISSLPYTSISTIKRYDNVCGLLRSTSDSSCEDPRDRIYALLSLFDHQLTQRVIPDYTLTTAQVYEDFTLKYIQQYRSLALLQFCDLHLHKIDGPTWIPDWMNTAVRPWQQVYASGLSKAESNLLQPGVLGVLGVRVAQVAAISDSNWIEQKYPTTITEAFETIKIWYTTWLRNVPEGTPLEEFISAIRFGWVWERRRLGQSAKAYVEEFLKLIANEPSEEELSCSELIQDIFRDEKMCNFFCTSQGQCGMGPIGTRPGDVIAVILGCPHSLVLQPADSGRYKVVGPAFVHGLMDGEAVLGPVPKPWAIKIVSDGTRGDIWTCYDDEKGLTAPEDVRLGELPLGWSKVREGVFRNPEGEMVEDDPRFGAEYLTSRGIHLETLQLV